jgi:hypothetical protein
MTPADEARFIALWSQGIDTAAMAQPLGIPRGTVSSRASTLVRQGKIQPRPRGGAYPKQKALARSATEGAEGAPAGPPAPTRTPGTIKQWTVRLSQPLIDAVKEQAKTKGKEPSHLVEECLWHALSECRTSTP